MLQPDDSLQGYIYVEAIAEPQARTAIAGINGIYQTFVKRVPVREVQALLNVTVPKKVVKVRIAMSSVQSVTFYCTS